ncbi:MAG: M15 family metallopeptidase [Prevotellaceae bacterium]|jgi:D-alanyl-D-alanine dipeptidase|nr:M15 family metallopeptidase [Prevotellaceae bacterium]
MKRIFCLLFVCASLVACHYQSPEAAATVAPEVAAGNEQDGETALGALGLIDVATLDGGIRVQLIYATPYNFMGKVLYRDIRCAYLQPDAAQKLLRAYKALKKIRPDLTLLVYDAARPLSVQWEMWNAVKGSEWNYYVKNPSKGGGMHNFGAAVDVTLADCTGQPLPMGTPYDYFGSEANIDKEKELVRAGRITPREWENRLLLRRVMTGAGFRTVTSEWWHFNSCSLEEAKKQYKVIK